jgi:hypothetical protein
MLGVAAETIPVSTVAKITAEVIKKTFSTFSTRVSTSELIYVLEFLIY